ncbi:MAG: hypothetical protein H6727_13665 [Myxococcales bacterium]|nr:hypothetical protein [Myxococcales bacterium]
MQRYFLFFYEKRSYAVESAGRFLLGKVSFKTSPPVPLSIHTFATQTRQRGGESHYNGIQMKCWGYQSPLYTVPSERWRMGGEGESPEGTGGEVLDHAPSSLPQRTLFFLLRNSYKKKRKKEKEDLYIDGVIQHISCPSRTKRREEDKSETCYIYQEINNNFFFSSRIKRDVVHPNRVFGDLQGCKTPNPSDIKEGNTLTISFVETHRI